MKIKVQNTPKKTQLLCGFALEKSDKVLGLPKLDAKTSFAVNQSLKDIEGKSGKLSVIPSVGKKQFQRILIAGIGKKEDVTKDTFRQISGKIAQKARELKLKEFSIIVPPTFVMDQISSSAQIVEGAKMALYKFEKFKAEKEENSPDMTIIVSKSNKVLQSIKTAEVVADGAIFTKSIANLPPNECTPSTLANFAKTISKNKMKCKIISKPELKKKG
ncbi:MAG: aminopeptidase, partial [Nitrosopumilus sp.]